MVAELQFYGSPTKLLFVDSPLLIAFNADCCCYASAGRCFLITANATNDTAEPAADLEPPFPEDGTDARYIFEAHAKDKQTTPWGTNYHNHLWIIETCLTDGAAITDYLTELATWETDNEGGYFDDITIEDVGNCAEGDHGDYDALKTYAQGLINTPFHPTTADDEEILFEIDPGGLCV